MPLPKRTKMAFKSISNVQLPTSFNMTCYWLPRIGTDAKIEGDNTGGERRCNGSARLRNHQRQWRRVCWILSQKQLEMGGRSLWFPDRETSTNWVGDPQMETLSIRLTSSSSIRDGRLFFRRGEWMRNMEKKVCRFWKDKMNCLQARYAQKMFAEESDKLLKIFVSKLK